MAYQIWHLNTKSNKYIDYIYVCCFYSRGFFQCYLKKMSMSVIMSIFFHLIAMKLGIVLYGTPANVSVIVPSTLICLVFALDECTSAYGATMFRHEVDVSIVTLRLVRNL